MPGGQASAKSESENNGSSKPVLLLQGASFNCEYNPDSGDWRLLEWLQQSAAPTEHNSPSTAVDSLGTSPLPLPPREEASMLPGSKQFPKQAQGRNIRGNKEGESGGQDEGKSTTRKGASSSAASTPDIQPLSNMASLATAVPPGKVVAMLSRSDATMGLTVDLRAGPGGELQVLMPDAKLQVPHEMRYELSDGWTEC